MLISVDEKLVALLATEAHTSPGSIQKASNDN